MSTPDPAAEASARRRLLSSAAAGLVAIVVAFYGLTASEVSAREGPWRATYFDDPDFDVAAEVLREGDVRFEWAGGAARPHGPRDDFSVRFETCLRTDGDPVMFQLVSNDASSLYVDDELVVDNSGRHPERSRGSERRLAAGVHRLRVDYRDFEGRAMVALVASFDGMRPRAIPVRHLSLPAADGTCPQ
jgi:hypothetical protein